MTIRNTNYTGSNWSDGDILYAADLNDTYTAVFQTHYRKVFANNTGGAGATTATLTGLGSVVIPQNSIGSIGHLNIMAGVSYQNGGGADIATFSVYVAGSSVKSVAISNAGNGEEGGTSLNYLFSGLNSTAGDTVVEIKGQTPGSQGTFTCNSVIVDAMYKNG